MRKILIVLCLVTAFYANAQYSIGYRCQGVGLPSAYPQLASQDATQECLEYQDISSGNIYNYKSGAWVLSNTTADNASLIAGTNITITGTAPALTINANIPATTNTMSLSGGVLTSTVNSISASVTMPVGLPTASAANQVPLSTGAGTTYTAQTLQASTATNRTGITVTNATIGFNPSAMILQTIAPTASGSAAKFVFQDGIGNSTMILSDIAKFVNYRDTVLITRTIFDGSTVLPIAAGIRSEGYWRVPEELDGYTLVRVNYEFFSVPGTGTDYVLVVNQEALGGGGSNLVPLSVSAGSAAHRFVAGATTVVKGDMLRVNVTTAGSAIPSGLVINYVFAR